MSGPCESQVIISLEEACLGYGAKRVLEDVNLQVRVGDFLGIVGPNGSGKTTLLKTILNAIRPLRGRMRRSLSATPRGTGMGYVPQIDTIDLLYPLTALEVVRMGALSRRWGRRFAAKQEIEKSRECLRVVGLGGLEDLLFRSMSGGQRQRTLLARALATGSEILILDEPTAGMDMAAEKSVMDLIAEMHRRGERTVLLVTHQLNLVARYARQIAVLKDRRVTYGAASEILTDQALSAIYETDVHVESLLGRRVVFTP